MEGCTRCGTCCEIYPCFAEPRDIVNIARYLDVSYEKLLDDYFIWDYVLDEKGEYHYHLCPKRKTDIKGLNFASNEWGYKKSTCIFYSKKEGTASCKIHDVKPVGARMFNCMDQKCVPGISNRVKISRKWKLLARRKGITGDYRLAPMEAFF